MEGVVSLLDERHYARTEALWAELERECAVHGVYATPYPHFSYQVADAYGRTALDAALRRFAAGQAPFLVMTAGLGLFTGERPVVYLPIVRRAALSRFHAELWQALSGLGTGVQAHYEPDNWAPHITIGFGDVDADRAGAIAQHLAGREFVWRVAIDNIAFIGGAETEEEVVRYPLGE